MRLLLILSGVIAFAVPVGFARTFGSLDPAARQEIAAPVAQTRSMTRLACSFEDCKAQCYYGDRGQLLPRAQRDECMRVCRRRQENC